MNTADQQAEPPRPAPWRPRYGLGVLMLMTLVCAVTASCGYYLVQAVQGGVAWRAVFVIFTLVAPVFLLSILSLGQTMLAWLGRDRDGGPSSDDDLGRDGPIW